MSRFRSFIEQHFDIYTESGDEVCVLCPFHGDRKPSMYVNVRKGVFHCKACGKSGGVDLIAAFLDVDLRDTGVAASSLRSRLAKMSDAVSDHEQRIYDESWLDRFDFEHDEWSEGRGFTDDVIDQFNLGYDPRLDRLTIPIRDSYGRVLGVIYRRLDNGRPKYLYPKGFAIGKSLFGSWEVRKSNITKVALVEGPLDAIACWDARIPALAMLGSQLTRDQRKLLLSLGVKSLVIFTDRDNAGLKATVQVKQRLYKSGIIVRVAEYRSYWTAKDPAELKPVQRRKAFHSAIDYRTWWATHRKEVPKSGS